MAKVWINPAFKDKVPKNVKEKESKPQKSIKKDKKGVVDKKSTERKPRSFPIYSPPDPVLELKFLEVLREKEIPLEAELIDGTKFTGKIKWFSEWAIALEVENRESEVIFNRLQMIYYRQLKKHSLSEKELEKLPDPNVGKVEINALQQFKEEKTPLHFHLKNNGEIKGILDWCEKLIYHVKSLDGEKEYNLYKNSVIYFERMITE